MTKSIYLILEQPHLHKYGRFVNFVLYSLIILSIISLYISTIEEFKSYQNLFDTIETVTMFIFTIEFLLRLISAGEDQAYKGFKGRLKFLATPFVILDLLVILPFYLMLFGIDLIFLRILRILRIFKLFRNSNYQQFDDTLIEIFQENKEKFFVILIISAILIFLTAPIMYYLEFKAQPEVFSSIPAALWWTTVTFTTVGYGDMYPITTFGKILATFVSVLGIAFYTIPGAIFTSSLLNKLKKK